MRGDDVSTETWRVIDEDGTGHAATVEASEGGLVAVTIDRRCGYPCDTPVRAAIAREAWAADIAVAEILAPGQPSRAEISDTRGVEAMREACADLCDARAVDVGSNALQFAANAIRALKVAP